MMKYRRYAAAARHIIVESVRKYQRDDPIKLAGTTAYFVVFAVAPILIIITAVFGLVVDAQTVSVRLYEEIAAHIGTQAAEFVQTLVESFRDVDRGLAGTIVGIAVFLFSSTTFFSVLQKNLNFIWRVRAKPKSNLLNTLRDRLLSFGLILSLGFVLLVSLLIDVLVGFLRDLVSGLLSEHALFLIQPINVVVSFGIVTVIFVLIFKFLPDTKVPWRVTWVGALVTAVLFTIGKYIFGVALSLTDVGEMYGAAGSVVILLVWVFYSSIILYFGAEVTEQYAHYLQLDIEPQDHAVRIEISEVDERRGPAAGA